MVARNALPPFKEAVGEQWNDLWQQRLEESEPYCSSGSSIRISVNGSDFPNVWPTPRPGSLSLHWGPDHPSHFTLPVWGGGREPEFESLPSPDSPAATGSGLGPRKTGGQRRLAQRRDPLRSHRFLNQ